MTDRLLTARELADQLGVNAETVLRWSRRGELPTIKLPGGAIRYREHDIDQWLRRHETGAADRGVSATRNDRAQAGPYDSRPLVFPVSATPPHDTATTEEDP